MKQALIVLSNIFDWIWTSSAMAAVLLAVIIAAKWLLNGRLGVRWQYMLWFLLLFRLLLPWAPESPFSLYQLFYLEREQQQRGQNSVLNALPPQQADVAGVAPANAHAEYESGSAPSGDAIVNGEAHGTAFSLPFKPAYGILLALWLAGMIGFAIYTYKQYRGFAGTIRTAAPVEHAETVAAYERCLLKMGIGKKLPLLATDRVESPTLYGFIRPRLLLPSSLPGTFSQEECMHIFLHELAHYKRMDIGVNWLMTGLLIIHWFNPLLWYAYSRMREDQELACDASALSYMGAARSGAYGGTLIKLLENSAIPSGRSGMASFSQSHARLHRRIRMIKAFNAGAYKRSALGITILLLLAVVSLTNGGVKGSGADGGDGGGSPSSANTAIGNDSSSGKDGQKGSVADGGAIPVSMKPLDMRETGTVTFRAEDSEGETILPLIAIAAAYGADGPEPVPPAPLNPLPVIGFTIPAEQQNQLAVYWMTTSLDGKLGTLLLGPRGWKAAEAAVGADGSVGIELVNPDDSNERLTFSDSSGGCQGCAIASIATYFPGLRQWAEDMAFPGSDMKFEWQNLINPNLIAYAKDNAIAGFETNGVAYQTHDGGAWFRDMEIKHAAGKHKLATTMLNFFVAQYGRTAALAADRADSGNPDGTGQAGDSGSGKTPIDKPVLIAEGKASSGKGGDAETIQLWLKQGYEYNDSEPGPFQGTTLSGQFEVAAVGSDGKILSTFGLNDAFGGGDLSFRKDSPFPLLFDDYNGDGDPDFTIGQWAGSNGNMYVMLSIGRDGFRVLERDIYTAERGGSVQFRKKGKFAFVNEYYDQEKGSYMQVVHRWKDGAFRPDAPVEVRKVE